MSVTQSCPTLCDPMDYSPQGSSVHGILQAKILEWVSIPFSREFSWPRDWNSVSHRGRFFTIWVTREAPSWSNGDLKKNLCYFISFLCFFFLSERDMSHGSGLYFRPAVIMAGGKYQKHWNEQTVDFEALFKMVYDIYAYISFGQSKSRWVRQYCPFIGDTEITL